MAIQIQFRNDTAANWTSANPTLLAGEQGYETDTGKLKIGNGSTAWNSLAYFANPLTLVAGTTTVPPLKFTSGTNLTSATAGAVEYDGSVFYADVAASTRGTLPAEQITELNTAYTLTSQTAAQKLFNATTNGAVTLPVGTYQFECFYYLSSMSSTSGTYGFALGGAATFTQQWWSLASKASGTLTTATAAQSTYNITSANTALTSIGGSTVGFTWIRGIINVTVAGTVIPQVSLNPAAAAVVGVGSYFKISPFSGTNSTTNIAIGNWS
jgi:hypothetical protein